jgi:ABC-type uncharacterized transport system ATPase subunit
MLAMHIRTVCLQRSARRLCTVTRSRVPKTLQAGLEIVRKFASPKHGAARLLNTPELLTAADRMEAVTGISASLLEELNDSLAIIDSSCIPLLRCDTVELLELFTALYGRTTPPADLLDKVNLNDKAQARPNKLSGGQKQRFSIACALVNDPKVLFLDEPTTGLDPQAKRSLWELVRSLNKAGMTIVLTTHNMEEAEFLCDRLAIMDHGKVIAQGTPAQLIQQYAPDVPPVPRHGNLEDVFLHLTGSALRE